MSVVLRAQALSRSFRRGGEVVHALKDLDIELKKGEFLAVTGPSGSGKSTLLCVIAGMLSPDSGTLSCPGGAALVFQDAYLVPYLSVRENLELPALFRRQPADLECRARSLAALRIESLQDRSVATLSRGEAQRVAIARALESNPALLLLDEPTANLDEETGLQLMELLWQLLETRSLAIVLATHDPAIAAACGRELRIS